MGITAQGGGGGASVRLQNLKSPLAINIPEFNVPRLSLEEDGNLSSPAISFASSPNSGIALRGISDRFAIIVDGDECIAGGSISGTSANCLFIVPSILNSGPVFTSIGADSDIDMNILPRGNGAINLLGPTLVTDELGPLAAPTTITVGDDASAIFECRSVTKGFLPPQMTTVQRDAIASPAEGLVIHNLTTNTLDHFDGAAWENLKRDVSCKVTKSADQTISNNTTTVITWNQEDYDTDGMHDNVTNNSRITIKTAGKYSALAQIVWASNSTGKRIVNITKNSVVIGKMNYLASGSSQHTISAVDDFVVNDILEVSVFQDSGGNLDFLAAGITYFEAHKIN